MSETYEALASDLAAYRVTLAVLRRLIVDHIGGSLGGSSDELHDACMNLGRSLDEAGLSVKADIDQYLVDSEYAHPSRAWVRPSGRNAPAATGWGAPRGGPDFSRDPWAPSIPPGGFSDEPPF